MDGVQVYKEFAVLLCVKDLKGAVMEKRVEKAIETM